jgi:arylformamidase
MAIHDVSVAISAHMPVWPGDPSVELERVSQISQGANANVSRLACSVHIGTHVDAPGHFLDGRAGVDHLSLDLLLGEALVIELMDVDHIDAGVLKEAGIPFGERRLLFKTRNSEYWDDPDHEFREDFVAVEADGARWLVDHGVRLLGVDYLSVAPFGRSRPTHEILLGAEVILVEGLDLRAVSGGRFELACLPLKLRDCDGAPARVILRDL